MGFIRTVALTGLFTLTGGVAGVGAKIAYGTNLVPLTKEDQVFKTKLWKKFNPRENPALKDDCIKSVALDKIRPELRNDEAALTLAFCKGVWSRWGFWPQSKLQDRYDHPEGTDNNLWYTSELAKSDFKEGTRFSNHFEVVQNSGNEVVVRCGGSPLEPGLRKSDGLIWLSARIDPESQHAVFHFKSALFSSGAPQGDGKTPHSVPPKITFLHEWYVRILTEAAMKDVKA
ncbi:hypothetical protein F5Y16DRAFT_75426 [Xylariaceae sp. FL0255]|nr:hypothetical protein F5Y16DRAFT_75426 [Xylariaceae sp. FL0255]